MKARFIKAVLFWVVIAGLFALPCAATQVTSNTASVALSMNVSESLSITATPATISFTPSGTTATASGPITVTTSWQLNSTRASLYTAAYFSTPSSALANGSSLIPSSDVFASVDSATAAACSGTSLPMAGLGISGGMCGTNGIIFNGGSQLSGGTFTGSHSDTILLSMQGLPTLNAGSYSGTLTIVAAAQ
jgi:hypothetical protein